ncbi:MAG: PQQ-binding-like beta-propeller repeat protein [Gemmatimonadetes bacterium]|nr:PQQ-binding-like beta-propeller repeat protein [Gemmatimonadota bacterium]MYG83856.1 PQQ-binding-like beta-propeller repeat protein [Gemmatimonadota bacterium]MYJ90687.1 PQQ-binding-like beta-propeller repeat protein [Gemmatimonadota bacterium]
MRFVAPINLHQRRQRVMSRFSPLFRWTPPVIALAMAITVLASCEPAAQRAPGKIIPVEQPDSEWRMLGRDLAYTRYSPLDQINADNVDRLEVAWRWKQDNFGPRPEYYAQPVPIYVGGMLYSTAGTRRSAMAIEPETGETMWTYRPVEDEERWATAPRRNSGRGVSFWTDGQGDNRVILITRGFYLVALDAQTGIPVAEFGNNGVVDMMEGWRNAENVTPVGNLANTSPATVVGDIILVPPALAAGFRPRSMTNSPGDVVAYDARSGAILWKFKVIPDEGEEGAETWEQNSRSYTGNAGVWTSISADTELGYAYLPVEAPTNDYYGGHRLGDNLYANSLVAVDYTTGEKIWHFQIVHHDIWDYDNPAAPILADVTIDGEPRKIVIQNTKQGYSYVFDRVTGEPIWDMPETDVPASDVPGDRASPTQPIPVKPAPWEHQGISQDDLVDFTPAVRQEAINLMANHRYGPLYQPPSLAEAPDGTIGTIQIPGANGGVNWNMTCLDPVTGVNFIPSNTSISKLALRAPDPEESDMDYFSAGLRAPRVFGQIPLVRPPWGRITAVDMNTGDHVWMAPNGDTPQAIKDLPELAGVDLPRTGKATRIGSLVTSTLLFAGEGFGGDPYLHAYDKATGEVVASIELPAAQSGMPMTYMHNDVQYLIMTVGAGGHPAELIALKLGPEPEAEEGE